ncbi:hypothetical protein DFH08DRAFT_820563 [Mycena albidolilacea]|uniref:Uncharacterized protein n=1 Tax=Mycena albidolilacea TaxID=1033008 RepID=A0AAD6ZCB5_9AGAR|nr:hypothetical protein DFH08DRAFT_820563 [Mycena albidolilacea]
MWTNQLQESETVQTQEVSDSKVPDTDLAKSGTRETGGRDVLYVKMGGLANFQHYQAKFEVILRSSGLRLLKVGRRCQTSQFGGVVKEFLTRTLGTAIWCKQQDYPGRLSFGTNAWTSPNHQAFVVWIVHLQHKGELLSFPLDMYEVLESHTREVLAWEFDKMLAQFNIQHKKKGKAVKADDEEDEEGGDFLLEDNKEMLDLVAVSRSEGKKEDSSEENSAWNDLGATEQEELLKETNTVKKVITKVYANEVF